MMNESSPFIDMRVLSEMMERAPTAFLALDHTWRVVYINPEGALRLRRTPAELIGRHIWEEFPQAVGGTSYLAYHRAMADGITVRIEEFYPPLDRWFDVFAYPINNGVAVHFADVTERKEQEVQLAQSEHALARAQQIARIGSWRWDIDTDTVQWSEETYRLLAFADDDRPATARMEEYIHPDDIARNWTAIQQTLATGTPYDIVLRMHPHDGSTRIYHALAETEVDPHGRITCLFGTIQDITERVTLERAAEADKRDLHRAFRVARMANYWWDLPGDHLGWSPEYFDLLGLDPATFVPLREAVLALIHPDDLPYVRATSAAAFASATGFEMHYRVRHADGGWRHFSSVAEIERDAAGMMTRVVGSVRDRTDEVQLDEERMRLEQQMQQAQKLESLGVLAGGIAHDFNNLLVGILGNASLAMMDASPTGLVHELLSEIESAGQRAADLTRQLLAYAGKGRFIVEPLALSSLVEEMLTLVRSSMNRKAELHLELLHDLPAIAADATQLRQIVMNLLTNASDALEDHPGTIMLRTGVEDVDATYRATVLDGAPLEEGRYVFLEVSDTGVGMTADTVRRIFDPFFTTKFTGRGLGLAATRGIMQGHRGAIKVYSEMGKGTTFKLFFPAVSAPAVERPSVVAVAEWRGSGTVLVIDDEPAVRRVTRVVLERLGFDVLEASDGVVGVEIFQRERARIRLTLLDLTMPRLDGEETFRQLRLLDPQVRVVLMSGYNSQNATSHFVEHGLAGFMQKPFRADELEAQVRAVIER